MKLGKIINCNYINQKTFNYIKKKFFFFFTLNKLSSSFFFSILTNNNKESLIYLKKKSLKAKDLYIDSCIINVSQASENKILYIFKKLFKNNLNSGILIQLPLRKDLSYLKISNLLYYNKDLDFILNKNIGNYNICYLKNSPSIIRSCLLLLTLFNIKLCKKNILIINKSNLIGKPLLGFFLNQNLSVTISNGFLKNINKLIKKNNLIFSAVGVLNFLKLDKLKNNSIIFDLGFGRNNKGVFGDLEYSKKIKKVKLLTTVPFGIGSLNINFLFENFLKILVY